MKTKRKLTLPAWIFIGMVAGILCGLCFLGAPEFTKNYIKPIGTIYINLLMSPWSCSPLQTALFP